MEKHLRFLIILLVVADSLTVSAQCNFTGNFLAPTYNCSTGTSSVKLRLCSGTIPSGPFYLVGGATTYSGTVGGALGPCPKTVDWSNIPVGNYTLKVNTTICSSYTVAVTTPTSGIIDITPAQSPNLCQGQSITLNASGGSNYSWSANTGGSWTGTSITVSPSSNTTYTLTGTKSGTCGGTGTDTQPVFVTPVVGAVSITSGAVSRCQGIGTNAYTASATNANAENGYIWTLTSNESISPGSISPSGVVTWNVNFSGLATVKVTAYGCNGSTSGPASRNVTVNFTAIAYNVAAPSSICAGTTTTVVLTGSQSTVSYQLFKNNLDVGASVPGTGATLQWTGMTEGTYKVIAYPVGCPSLEMLNQKTIGTTSPGVLTITPSGSPTICQGESITLTAGGGSNYSWSANTGGTWSGSPITVTPSVTTTYTLTGSESVCQTLKTKTLPVTVKPLPNATITPVGSQEIPSYLNQQISASPNGSNYTFKWLKGEIEIGGASNSTYTATESGSYRVTITLDGCPKTSNALILTKNSKPEAHAGDDIMLVLPDRSVTLNGSGTDADGAETITEYHWTKESGPEITLPETDTQSLVLEDLGIGTYIFCLTVKDHLEISVPDCITVTVTAPPNNYNRITETIVLIKDIVNESQLDALQILESEKNVNINYFDGLGRPMQSVTVQGSPLFHDLVQSVVYDAQGREANKYLPLIINETNGFYKPNSGIINPDIGTSGTAANFYNDSRPFREAIFEPSPVNRKTKTYGPGNDWKVAGKYVEQQYLSNVHNISLTAALPGEKIVAWIINSSTGRPMRAPVVQGYIRANGYYDTGQLLITSTQDEEGNEVREYVDKTGRIILKKVQVKAVTSLNSSEEWALTYYIYDEFGSLRFVLQPILGAKILASDTYVADEADLNKLAFRYKYDARRRMVEKKIPGAEAIYMVYDKYNRLVMTQDGNQRKDALGTAKKEWSFTKYDDLNRQVLTGIYTHPTELLQLDMANWLADSPSFSESYNGVASSHGYTNVVRPTSSIEVYTATFYDNYHFRDDMAGEPTYEYLASDLTNQEVAENLDVLGLVTGSKINILGSTQYLWNVTYYDKKYRIVQTKNQNHKGGVDRTTNVYDFTRLKETLSLHETSLTAYSADRKFDYDHMSRLLTLQYKFNTDGFVILQKNSYNEKGELSRKQLHSRDGGNTFAQSIDYTYNIRGWLNKINDPANQEKDDLFSLDLRYQDPSANGGSAQFSGNVSEILWKSAGLDNQSYGYKYDAMNRLVEANYFNATKPVNNGNYTEKIGDPTATNPKRDAYDFNGNIQNLIRYGKVSSTTTESIFGLVDDLTYSYLGQDNQLTSIEDAKDDSNFDDGFKEPSLGATDEYAYDWNGNTVKDNNKGINPIEYNSLNLPKKVSKSGTEYITYTYDATGKKLSQQVFGSTPKTTDYLGDYVYEETPALVLQFVNHEEGRIVPDNSVGAPRPWDYQYFLKDHLGNVRVSFSEKNTVSELKTTFEEEENSEFLNYSRTAAMTEYDHTDVPGTMYTRSHELNAGNASTVGAAKGFVVNPGDIFDLEVYAKFADPSPDEETDLNGLITDLIRVFNLGATSTGLESVQARNAFQGLFSPIYIGDEEDIESVLAPRAYLNYILFDENFVLVDFGFDQISLNANQNPAEPLIPHDYLNLHVQVHEKGYLYVYLSNESEVETRVFFDDFKITYNTNIQQLSDYYAFGLTFNSYKRENSVKNKYLYNGGAERQDGLDLNVDATKYRMYDPAMGRWWQMDPMADLPEQIAQSPYQYGWNNPIRYNDPNGDCPCLIPAIPYIIYGLEALIAGTATYIAYDAYDRSKFKAETLQIHNEGSYLNNSDPKKPNFNSVKKAAYISAIVATIARLAEKNAKFFGVDPREVEKTLQNMSESELQMFSNNVNAALDPENEITDRQFFGLINPALVNAATVYDFKKGVYSLERGLSPEQKAAQEQEKQKGQKANELLNNFSNAEEGTYTWNGNDWVLE
jgi:RHS repeat-associated protein